MIRISAETEGSVTERRDSIGLISKAVNGFVGSNEQ